jgi:hypothetical protein
LTLTISDTDLWDDGGNILVALPPSRDDLFVVVTHNGKVIARGTILDYDDAVQNAKTLMRRARDRRPITIKVLCLSGREAIAWGFMPDNLFADQTPEQEAELRRTTLAMLIDLLRTSADPVVRSDALDLLRDMGELP